MLQFNTSLVLTGHFWSPRGWWVASQGVGGARYHTGRFSNLLWNTHATVNIRQESHWFSELKQLVQLWANFSPTCHSQEDFYLPVPIYNKKQMHLYYIVYYNGQRWMYCALQGCVVKKHLQVCSGPIQIFWAALMQHFNFSTVVWTSPFCPAMLHKMLGPHSHYMHWGALPSSSFNT